MNKFRYAVSIVVEVEAFSEEDAWDTLQDSFGIGENAPGTVVTECEWTLKKK